MKIQQYRRQVDLPGPEGKQAVARTGPGQMLEGAGQVLQQATDTTARIGQALGQIEFQRKRQQFTEGFNQFMEEQIASNPDPGTYMELFEQYVSGTEDEQGLRQSIGEEIRNPWAKQMWDSEMDRVIEEQRHGLSMQAIRATQEIGYRVNQQTIDEAIKNQDWAEAYRTIDQAWEAGNISEDVYHQWQLTAQRAQKKEAVWNDTVTILQEQGEEAAYGYLQSALEETEGPISYRPLPPAYDRLQEQIEETQDERIQLQDELSELIAKEAPEEEIERVNQQISESYEEVKEIQQDQVDMMEGTEAMELITPKERGELRNRLGAFIKDSQPETDWALLNSRVATIANWYGGGADAEWIYNKIQSDDYFAEFRDPPDEKTRNKLSEWMVRLRKDIDGESMSSKESENAAQDTVYGLFNSHAEGRVASPRVIRALNNLGSPLDSEGEQKSPIMMDEMERLLENGLTTEDGRQIPAARDGRASEELLEYLGDRVVIPPRQWEGLVDDFMEKTPEGPESAGFALIEQLRSDGDLPDMFPNVENKEYAQALTALTLRERYATRLKEMRKYGETFSSGEHRQMVHNLINDTTDFNVRKMMEELEEAQSRGTAGRNFLGFRSGEMFTTEETEKFLTAIQQGEILGRGQDYKAEYTALSENVAMEIFSIAPNLSDFADLTGQPQNRVNEFIRQNGGSYDPGTLSEIMIGYDEGIPVLPVGDRFIAPFQVKISRGAFRRDMNFRIIIRSKTNRVDRSSFNPNDWEIAYMPDVPGDIASDLNIPVGTNVMSDEKRTEGWWRLMNINEALPSYDIERREEVQTQDAIEGARKEAARNLRE